MSHSGALLYRWTQNLLRTQDGHEDNTLYIQDVLIENHCKDYDGLNLNTANR